LAGRSCASETILLAETVSETMIFPEIKKKLV
jgi:hypothetical protein